MKFSKAFLDKLRSSISLADLIGEKVIWDQKKTRPSQGDFWAPCPFHEEKTASFHVSSDKGFYYCFGCHAKGDCFTFLKEYERFSFSESVTYLAEKSNIPVPKNDYSKSAEDRNEIQLIKIHEKASHFFSRQLKASGGLQCRKYLRDREVSMNSIEHFNIGFASNSKSALYDHLKGENFNTSDILLSGLCIQKEPDSKPYDRFRNRVMFPIKDAKDRTIAFGGRSLNANSSAKYLNSPETPIFSKGKTVYNYANARAVSKSQNPLLVVEGYMDVISLHQADISFVVAPLGTAMTESQVNLLWRLDPEPVIVFDGDKAGRKAASRLLSIALPFLEPKKSIRFARLPIDQDPDDFLKLEGKENLLTIVRNASPAIEVIWTDLIDGTVFDSPERKASLDLTINKTINLIRNVHLRKYFFQAVSEMKRQFFANLRRPTENRVSKKTANSARQENTPLRGPLLETKNSFLGKPTPASKVELRLREGIILLGCFNHPEIAHSLENELSRISFKSNDLKKIRDAILTELPIKADITTDIFQEKINMRLRFNALETLRKIPQLKIHPFLGQECSKADAKKAIGDAINHHNSLINFQMEIKLAEGQIINSPSELTTDRIYKAGKILQETAKGATPTALIDSEAAQVSLKRLNVMIKDKIWIKKKK